VRQLLPSARSRDYLPLPKHSPQHPHVNMGTVIIVFLGES
jgi:hypothetical protein